MRRPLRPFRKLLHPPIYSLYKKSEMLFYGFGGFIFHKFAKDMKNWPILVHYAIIKKKAKFGQFFMFFANLCQTIPPNPLNNILLLLYEKNFE